jgi:crotonobetainyl-CoA:carnitine CoA-transferase CaiB-like acyl-CoA transferase
MALPLAGIRVLDLSRALAGPFCATILGDLGADVVKVEPSPGGEMIRSWGPFTKGISVYYLSVNRNKRSLAVDFRNPASLDLLRDMAATADVVVENFKPGTMEKMGLSYDTLRAANSKLVYAGITGFGRDGPYGDWPGLDQIAQGMSGLMSVTGQKGGGPTRVGIPIGDLVAGMWTALGVQAALIQRVATGTGQRVESSLLAGLVGLLCLQGQRYLSLGEVPGPAGNDHPIISPYGMFQASDGPFNMAAVTDEMWAKLCRLVAREDLAGDPDFAANSGRVANRERLTSILNVSFASRTRAEWTDDLIALGLPAGPILDMAGVFDDPHVRHMHLAEEIEHPVLGPLRQLASPIRLDSMEGRSVRRPPPGLGEHSREVLTEWGVDPGRIAALISDGHVLDQAQINA